MDPLGLTLSITGKLGEMVEDFRDMQDTLDDLQVRMARATAVMQMEDLSEVVSEVSIAEVTGSLRRIHAVLSEMQKKDPRGAGPLTCRRAWLFAKGALVCTGSRQWTRRLVGEIDDLDGALKLLDTDLRVSSAVAARRNAAGPSAAFNTNAQKAFWKNNFRDQDSVSASQLATAFRNITLDPKMTCLHMASGIARGAHSTTARAVAASFGDMSPRSWARSRTRGPSKTTAFAGHAEEVTHVAVLGAVVVTSSDDRTAKVFMDWVLVSTLVGHSKGVTMSCVMPPADGEASFYPSVFTISRDHTLRSWDALDGRPLWLHDTRKVLPAIVASHTRGVFYASATGTDIRVLERGSGDFVHLVSCPHGVPTAGLCLGDIILVGTREGHVDRLRANRRWSLDRSSKTPVRRDASRMLCPTRLGHEVTGLYPSDTHAYLLVTGRAEATLLRTGPSGRTKTSEVALPDDVGEVRCGLARDASGTSFVVGATLAGGGIAVMAHDEGMLAKAVLRFDHPGAVTCMTLTSAADVIAGSDNGSVYLYRGGVPAVVVVGCMRNALYLPEVGSDAADTPVSASVSSLLIGPRAASRYDMQTHGVECVRQSSFIWHKSTHDPVCVTEILDGGGAPARGQAEKNPLWLTSVMRGDRLIVDFLRSSLHKETAVELVLAGDEVPYQMSSLPPRYVVLSFLRLKRGRHLKVVDLQRGTVIASYDACKLITTCLAEQGAVVLLDGRISLLAVSDGEVQVRPMWQPERIRGEICGCETTTGGFVLYCNNTMYYHRRCGEPPDCSNASLPSEIDRVIPASDGRVVGMGPRGRMFSIDSETLAPLCTYVTHPAHRVSGVNSDALVSFDRYGALVEVSLAPVVGKPPESPSLVVGKPLERLSA